MRRRGLSLLEVQVALLLLLLVSLYLMSLFASGQRHARRALEYSRASVLAQQRLEQARVVPVSELTPVTREESEPYAGYRSILSKSDYEDNLTLLQIEVISPSGARARAFTLVSDPSLFRGIVSDAFTHNLVWANGLEVRTWNEVTGSAGSLGTPDDQNAGGLAGSPGSNLLWRLSRDRAPVPFQESHPTPRQWLAPLGLPGGPPSESQAPPRFSGLASDLFGNALVAADIANRGLWYYGNGAWNGALLKPTSPPLGRPSALVSDPALSLIWVADEDQQCLRKFLCPAAAATYPAGKLDSSGPLGAWHKTQFRPPGNIGMGSPGGLAMDAMGYAVYVHDRARLYRYLDNQDPALGRWQLLGNLPEELIAAVPSGMACDRFGNRLYIAAQNGTLWKIRPVLPTRDDEIPVPEVRRLP